MIAQSSELRDRALAAHRSGRLEEAEAAYRSILKVDRHHAPTLHLLGLVVSQRGEPAQGASLIEKSLRIDAAQPDAWFNLGLLKIQLGDIIAAIKAFRHVIDLRPDHSESHFQIGALLQRRNDQAGSEDAYSKAVEINPNHAGAVLNRGVLRHSRGHITQAISDFKNFIRLCPDDSRGWFNLAACERVLGDKIAARRLAERALILDASADEVLWLHALICQDLGDFRAAERSLRKLIDRDPSRLSALDCLAQILRSSNKLTELQTLLEARLRVFPNEFLASAHLGRVMFDLGQPEIAIEIFEKILAIHGQDADVLMNLASALERVGKLTVAHERVRESLAIRPDHVESNCNLGVLYEKLGRREDALRQYSRTLQIDPNFVRALINRGAIYFALRRIDLAEQDYERVLTIQPTHAGVLWNMGLIRLIRGEIPAGWAGYENRFINDEFEGVYSTTVTLPRWFGEAVEPGTRLLVLHEQGLGDTIQFCRYLPLLAARGIRVTVLAPKPLHRLLRSLGCLEEIETTITLSSDTGFYCHLMSLPYIFQTSLDDIPYSRQAYLREDDNLRNLWATRLGPRRAALRIGVCWQGGKASRIPGRSIALKEFSTLFAGHGEFISLQKEIEPEDARLMAVLKNLRHFGDEQQDFADTAAILAAIDIVITVDTSVAHLAGAMGKETWILLPFAADWRWFENRVDSPWYKNVRLFRQRNQDDWSSPISEVKKMLKAKVDENDPTARP